KIIDDRFVNSKATSTLPTQEEIQHNVISGFVYSFNDPYTQYLSPKIAKQFGETLSGSFGGAGIELIYKNNNTVVVSALKNTPAYKAGIKPNDIIIAIDDVNVELSDSDSVVQKIRGQVDTKVKIKVFRPETKSFIDFVLFREIIKVPTIESKIIEDYFVISLYSFTIDSPELFRQEMINFLKSGKTNLVLDLRGNPGGSVDSAVLISSYFVDYDKVILKEKGKNESENKIYKAENIKVIDNNKHKIYVLQDGGSASASEIVAGVLQDYKIAKIYGQKSFGKGSVQEIIPLSDGSNLKMTVAN
ncbi:MAG: S41 family peptidase, partial [Cyanobium sp. MAG06]|nr:S41 family peptidase [Cyanobium sp. MAG06]